MSNKVKLSILTFIFILTAILFALYLSSNRTKPSHSNALTIDMIKSNYKSNSVKDIKEFKAKSGVSYALVNFIDEYNINSYEIYNLKTGARDIIPTNPYKVTLDELVDESYFVFLANGENNERPNITFPFKLRLKYYENEPYEKKFHSDHEVLYLPVDKSVTMGCDKDVKSQVYDIKPTLTGLEILFGPINDDSIYFADAAYIPITTTQYIKENNQLVFNFSNTNLAEKLQKNPKLIDNTNTYYNSIEITQKGTNSSLILNLKDKKTTYNIELSNLETRPELPYAKINFKYLK